MKQPILPLLLCSCALGFVSTANAKPPKAPKDTLEVQLVESQGTHQKSTLRYLVPLDGQVSGPRCEIVTRPRDGQQLDIRINCRGLQVRTTRSFPLKKPTLVAEVHDETGTGSTQVVVTRR
jgi:hypothetical protein